MSKLQLRSKRRPTSPTTQNGHAILAAPLSKKPKKTDHVDSSDSESSSDEFVRPPADLKVSSGCVTGKKAPSPVHDFSSIESSIFSGVSRLSESDTDDSDFEEVSNDRKGEHADVSSVKPDGHLNASASSPEPKPKEDLPKPVRGAKGRQTRAGKAEASHPVVDKDPNLSEADKYVVEDEVKDKGRATRASKRRPPAEETISSKQPKANLSKAESTSEAKGKLNFSRLSKSSVNAGKANQKDLEDDSGSKAKPSSSQKEQKLESKSKTVLSPRKLEQPAKQSKVKIGKAGPSKIKEETKGELVSVKSELPESLDKMDIAQLLALGEGLKTDEISPDQSGSGSEDWEEVDAADVKKHEIPKEGVQITLDAPEFSWRRKKQKDQQACLQAEMNRAFNRVRRELQLLCHKTSLLLWLAHGLFINRVINNDSVKAMALSLVPVDLSVPPKKAGRKYVDLLLKWFSKDFECSEGFPEVVPGKNSRSLSSILEQHFSRKYAKSIKELTFMFIAILRAVGMECRLIISFQPMPLKPQSDELLAISSKSKRGRQSKKGRKSTDESDNPDDPSPKSKIPEKAVKKDSASKISETKGVPKLKKSALKKEESVPGSVSPRKSEATASENSKLPANKRGRKSEPLPIRSPVKTRGSRKKASMNSYKEKTDSDDEDSHQEEVKPILSPEKKKGDKEVASRLKAAAAKRVPTNRRYAKPGTSKGSVTKSLHVDSDDDLKSQESNSNAQGSKKTNSKSPRKSSSSRKSKSQHSDSDSDFEPEPKTQGSHGKKSVSPKKQSSSRRSQSESSSESDSDFQTKPKSRPVSKSRNSSSPKKGQPSKSRKSKGKDDDSGKKHLTSSGSDYWVEVFLQDEERWTCVDVPSQKIDSTKEILTKATQPLCYVVAFNPNGTLKDVTKRYAPKFSQVTSKLRVSVAWWEKTLKPFLPKSSKREAAEDSEMNLVELDRPMPKSVGECKNHPLYVLERHLLKFQAIYPPDAPSLGFVRNEPIYARQNVYTLHSREIWMKDAKVVKLGEQPYKIVKARPKYDRLSGKCITDLPLEIFGPWQVEDYVPPPAVDGKVPRNAYGNVELFKPSMLPKGTVHLQVPGLTRVAKKLRIDCAPAVVGFDYHSGGCHPTYDGFVVCEEHVDVLMDAWNKEIDESAKRREDKHEKRVYGNWRRLIKGLLIREALKHRYDFKGEGEEEAGSSQSTVNIEALKASRITPENAPLPSVFPKLMANIRAQKTRQRKSTLKEVKTKGKPKAGKQPARSKPGRKRKNETSEEEEEESDWDSSTTEEDEGEMVLLSDEDSGSEFEDLKK